MQLMHMKTQNNPQKNLRYRVTVYLSSTSVHHPEKMPWCEHACIFTDIDVLFRTTILKPLNPG